MSGTAWLEASAQVAQAGEPLAHIESNGWQHMAALAVTMEMSGMPRSILDDRFVRAFARIDGLSQGDIPTTLGAACSFSDAGLEVQFLGPPAPEADMSRAQHWQETLRGRALARYDSSPPDSNVVQELLDDDLPWAILMHLPRAETEPTIPAVVIGREGRNISVYDPLKNDRRTSIIEHLIHRDLLGKMALGNRFSLLAVRRQALPNGGVQLHGR
jgi:hypothetical protein